MNKLLLKIMAFGLLLSSASYAKDLSLENLTEIARSVYIKSTGEIPLHVQVRELSDGDSFNIKGFEAASLTSRVVTTVLDRIYDSKVRRYAALISFNPKFAEHTRLDYLCVMTVNEDGDSTGVALKDCSIRTASNFAVFEEDLSSEAIDSILNDDVSDFRRGKAKAIQRDSRSDDQVNSTVPR